MALTCPQCATAMQEVKAEATTGYFIVLDQCPRCGGIWCDRWELYPVTVTAAERIDAVDREALQRTMTLPAEPLECPRCRARMRRFQDPALAADAHIQRCPNCDGLWLNRGDLRAFKQHGLTTPPSPAALDRLATSVCREATAWPTVRTIDATLDPAANGSAPPAVGPEIVKAATWIIVRAALHLLLHV